jgi:ABC-type phosphate transport system substrate-binding protein
MAATVPFSAEYASSISPQIGIDESLSISTKGVSTGTPGLKTASVTSLLTASGSSFVQILTSGQSESWSASSQTETFSFSSNKTGDAPHAASIFAAPIPLFPAPTTSTRRPIHSILLFRSM